MIIICNREIRYFKLVNSILNLIHKKIFFEKKIKNKLIIIIFWLKSYLNTIKCKIIFNLLIKSDIIKLEKIHQKLKYYF